MKTEQPYAVVDVGSNTVRLLVARLEGDELRPIHDRSEFVRLGLGVDTAGELRPDREQAAIEAIRELTTLACSYGAPGVRAIATSAVRDASNGAEFVQQVLETTGVTVEIISGEREAELTYLGATLGLDVEVGTVVCDLGGGSAELIYADSEGVQWARSEPLGSGRLTERFVSHDPAEAAELSRVKECVRGVLVRLPPAEARQLVFTGGTATHVAILAGLQGTIVDIDRGVLDRVADIVAAQPAAEVARTYRIREERARVLPAGVAVLQTVAGWSGADRLLITQHGIREGAILDRLPSREGDRR